MLRSENPSAILTAMAIDLLMMALAIGVASLLRTNPLLGRAIEADAILSWPVICLSFLSWGIAFISMNVYESQRRRDILRRLVLSISLGAAILAGLLYFSFRDVSRLWLIYLYALSLIFSIGWRLIFWFSHTGRRKQRLLIVGKNELGQQLEEEIKQEEDFEFLGFVDIENIQEEVMARQVDVVILALPLHAHSELSNTVVLLQALSIQVWMVADYLNLTMSRLRAQNLGGMLLLSLREPALSNYQRIVKRAFDLVIGLCLMIIALPVMGLIALLIKLDSRGDVFFRQKRVGENGQLFTMLKFRTMMPDAEARHGELMYQNEAGEIVHKIANDPRVTRFGQFLRRSSLDELPQLFNVLRGDMSLVGPRPEMPWLVENYKLWQRKRFTIPQGMTGWWQVNGRSEKLMHLNTQDDIYYIQNYSFWLDFYILLKTLPVVLSRRGAY
jgi:exopolysaccharide biosynthesis polyprenyl glycosylphosphotransferase